MAATCNLKCAKTELILPFHYCSDKAAKINSIDPLAWLTDVLSRVADHKIIRLDELMSWRYVALAA